MSRKIARITQDKKLLLANEVVEDNAKTSLNSDGRLDTDEIIEYPAELEGGRNLVQNTSDGIIIRPKNTGNASDNYNYARITAPLKKDVEYTLSFDVEITDGSFDTVSIYSQYGYSSLRTVPLVGSRVVFNFTATENTEEPITFIYAGKAGETRGNGAVFWNLQIEKGNKATPWTPAPEDLGLNYPDNIQNFGFNIENNNIITPEFIEGYPFTKPVIDDSLVLWLDGSTGNNYDKTSIWRDLSGNGNDGKLKNFGYIENSGWTGDGLRFDGVDDYVDCGNIKDLNSDGLTIEIMCKNDERDLPVSITKGQSGRWASNDFGLRTHIFYISDKADNLNQLEGVRPQQGKFNHIICRTSQKLGKLEAYINSVKVAEMTRTIDDIKITNQNVHINTRYTGGTRDKGEVKLIRIYNRALTDEEILQNYQAGQCSPLLAMRGDAIG